jgi:hypothetical protein
VTQVYSGVRQPTSYHLNNYTGLQGIAPTPHHLNGTCCPTMQCVMGACAPYARHVGETGTVPHLDKFSVGHVGKKLITSKPGIRTSENANSLPTRVADVQVGIGIQGTGAQGV